MFVRVSCKLVLADEYADGFKWKAPLGGQAHHVERSDGGFGIVVHGAVELGFSGKEMIVSAIILVSLDMPVVTSEGQVRAVDHDVLQYVQMPVAGRDPIRW